MGPEKVSVGEEGEGNSMQMTHMQYYKSNSQILD